MNIFCLQVFIFNVWCVMISSVLISPHNRVIVLNLCYCFLLVPRMNMLWEETFL